ncbi:cation diffusion facilitator family transporter [Ralstonia sp. UBA689]|uniref:cation diffusion facilitator family transporter n=1 Tax=Ralstonia sp. UBA689 TaxID=1947373 RepID=UPI0025EE252B|nr:cation diffusion facilitator family transporter [Ralstonia sp. UBA689]
MRHPEEIDLETTPDPDTEDASVKQAAARRSTLVSVGVNLGLTGVQVVAGVLAGSQALVADAIHSLSDLISDFVVLFASHHSQKGPDATHQFGHQRFENAASLALGLLLLAVGVGMLWSAVLKLEHPDTIQPVKLIALWVALGALVAKELLFRYMLAVAERVRSSMLVANAWHARSDAASSLVVALGITGNVFGYRLLDPVAALIVGLMVTRMGWRFGWDALHDLMDRAVDEETVRTIHQAMRETPGVLGVHDVKTRRMGDMILVDVHLEVDAHASVRAGHDIALEARRRVMLRRDVLNVMTHVDPVDTSARIPPTSVPPAY